MRFTIRTDMERAIGRRSQLQDEVIVSDSSLLRSHGLLAVLSDGIGGMEGGERFSWIATREMKRAFEADDSGDDLCSRLKRAYLCARKKALALRRDEDIDGGATVVAVLIRGDRCAFLSVGDSRIYLFRNGGLIQLNREQTLGWQLDELAALGRIPKEEAEHNIYRKAILNNLAEMADIPFDICSNPIQLQVGDKLALMSDGVFGTLSEAEITQCLLAEGVSGAQAIVDAVSRHDQPNQDNYSVIVLDVEIGRRRRRQGGMF